MEWEKGALDCDLTPSEMRLTSLFTCRHGLFRSGRVGGTGVLGEFKLRLEGERNGLQRIRR